MNKRLLLYAITMLIACSSFGAQQTINVGTTGNDGTGDTLRAAMGKANSNFTELYGTRSVATGGTGQTSYTNGQILIGNTSGNTLAKGTITGTANELTVTNGAGSITLSLPTALTFTGKTVTGGTFSGITLVGTIDASAATMILGPIASGTTLDAPIFTGDAVAVTATAGDSDMSVATTAFVQAAARGSETGVHATPTTTNPLSPTWTSIMHFVWYGATGTINLPAASGYSGRSILIYNTGAFTVTIDPNGADVVVRDGNVQTGGVSFTLSSGAGNYVGLISDGARWITLGYKGTLAVGS